MTSQPLSELAGALTIVAVYCADLAGVDVPAEVAAALTVIITSVVFRLHRRRPS